MSWPGADETPPSEPGAGSFDGRPSDAASLATFIRGGRLVRLTPTQVDSVMKLLSVPYETFPQPPFFAPLFGYTAEWQKKEVIATLIGNSVTMGRVVTPAEADALADLRSKFCSRVAWTPPVVLLSAFYFTNRGRTTFRFPFYTPKPASFNPTAFPSTARPFLTGPSAVRLWHVLRFGAYGAVAHYLIKSTILSFAQSSYVMSILTDDRLKDMRKTLTDVAKRRKSQKEHSYPPVSSPDAETPKTEDAVPYRPSSWTRPEQSQQQQQQPPPSQPPQWTQRAPESQSPQQDSDDAFLFDDASPIAPSQKQQPQDPSASSSPRQGSSWDRIRQRAKSEEGAPWGQGQQQGGESQGQQTTEQYTFAPGEQEKAYAKEQAQKEFDAMLERERRGVGDSGERR